MNRFENIPETLREFDQWVIVNADSKIPINADTGEPASSSDPATWSSFNKAVRRVNEGSASNIGYVFDDDGIVGIDIDAGYDEDGFITPEAARILGACRSYTERSRSGRGFHILVGGHLPFKGKNNLKGVEIYIDSRYFIMTGDVLLYSRIVENQEAVDYVLKTFFPETVREAGAKESVTRTYSPLWELPKDGRVKLRPVYPMIPTGCRNICLTSLAGMLHNQGYDAGHILDELVYANVSACDPCLDDTEVEAIVRSVTRYKR